MFLLILHPSRNLTRTYIYPINSLSSINSARAGESFIFRLISKYKLPLLRANKKELTEIQNNYFFFTAGLYDNNPVWVVVDAGFSFWFKHPVHYWWKHKIEIKRTKLSKGNKLKISKKVWKKVSSNEDLKHQQRKKVKSVYKSDNGPPQLNCWQAPLESKVVSLFGSPRYLPNGKGYYHSGVDLRGWTGTPIPAAADGKVVLAEHMIVPGNNVILSHGGRIYSRYMHLNEIKVNVGDNIKAGQIIGTSGSTGRVEGPHLHWEVLWNGRHADPHLFIQTWNQYCSRQ